MSYRKKTIKDIYALPLTQYERQILCAVGGQIPPLSTPEAPAGDARQSPPKSKKVAGPSLSSAAPIWATQDSTRGLSPSQRTCMLDRKPIFPGLVRPGLEPRQPIGFLSIRIRAWKKYSSHITTTR